MPTASDTPATPEPRRSRVPLHVAIVAAMGVGLLLGPLLGDRAAPLGELGTLIIQVIKATATPLLFFAIVGAILHTEIRGRDGLRLVGFAVVNASVALGLGLLLSNLLRPGEHLGAILGTANGDASTYAGRPIDFLRTFTGYVPSSFVAPFVENAVIGVVVLALVLGFALRAVRREHEASGSSAFEPVERVVASLGRVMEVVIGWVVKLVPLAVLAVVAKTVGAHGFAPLASLALYVAIAVVGMAVHVLLTYQLWVRLFARIPLGRFWRAAREPAVYALGTNSSLATLPVTLRALDRLRVSRSASALGACVGTNLNNDGILLYEGMAVLFVAQASGIHLDFTHQLLAAGSCLVAAMGVAGVPEAGFISLALVLNTVGLPVELLPLLLTVDWVVARARSVTNVLSDMVLSILLDTRRRPAQGGPEIGEAGAPLRAPGEP